MAIGVVIATYNGHDTLTETLHSVRSQTLEDFFCVIVDDGSSDGSADLARDITGDDSRFEVVTQTNAGSSTARNHGLSLLPGAVEWVSFMDTDDVWTPTALAELLATASSKPSFVGAHGLGQWILNDGESSAPGEFESYGRTRYGCAGGRRYPWPADAPTTFETLLIRSTVFPPGLVLARREAYERIGGFDPSMRLTEDWDVLIRLCRLGDLGFLDKVVIGYRKGGLSYKSSSKSMGLATSRTMQKAYWSQANSPEQRRLSRDAWRAVHFIQVHDHLDEARDRIAKGRIAPATRSLAAAGRASTRYLRGGPAPPR